jgi:FKBP-type peptidyl-prolyl cis-trans isomerase FkpA
MRKLIWLGAVAVALAGCQGNKGGATGAAATPTTDEEKTLYALGLSMGRQVAVFDLSPKELEMVKAGLTAQVTGEKPAVELETWGPKLQDLARTRSQSRSGKEKEKGKGFQETAAKEQGAEKTASGLVYKSLTEGTGPSPAATDRVKVHYRGTLIDGKEFDSSHKRGQPAEFALNQVIPCWTEGVQKMKVGGKAKLVCPSEIAYGERGAPPNIPPGATLQFEVELLEIVAPPTGAPPAAGHGPGDGHGH